MTRLRGRRGIAILAAVLIAGSLALMLSNYQRDIGQARERISTRSQIAQTRCGPIEYGTIGDGPPVLAVHGAGGGFDQGLDFGAALARSGFRVIAMSRFGYLRTPLPADASAAAQSDAHACLLDALNIPRAAILGASAGAPSSLQFALRHPDRCTAVVIIVPAVFVPRASGAPSVQAPAATEFLFNTVLKSDFLFWAAIHFARPIVIQALLATPPAVVENASADEKARVDEMLRHILPVSPRRLGLLNDAAVVSSLERYELERISVPTLVMSVADDLFGTFDGARYTAKRVPHARFVEYPNGGHLWVGHQRELISEIAGFLK
jgi:pimeloyl-ACP methyl ester carboxylesterase